MKDGIHEDKSFQPLALGYLIAWNGVVKQGGSFAF